MLGVARRCVPAVDAGGVVARVGRFGVGRSGVVGRPVAGAGGHLSRFLAAESADLSRAAVESVGGLERPRQGVLATDLRRDAGVGEAAVRDGSLADSGRGQVGLRENPLGRRPDPLQVDEFLALAGRGLVVRLDRKLTDVGEKFPRRRGMMVSGVATRPLGVHGREAEPRHVRNTYDPRGGWTWHAVTL